MVFVLTPGHDVLLFAVTGFIIILGAFLIVLLCKCCKKCRKSRSRPLPDDFVAESPAAPLIPGGGGSRAAMMYPPYSGGPYYGSGQQPPQQYQNLLYPTGEFYGHHQQQPQHAGEFTPAYMLPPPGPPGQQNPPGYGDQPAILYGEPPPPYDSIREAQQQKFYSGQNSKDEK